MKDERPAVVLEDIRLQLEAHKFEFSARLPAGRVIAIVGPSGAGKSTLLNLVAGFELAQAGQIILNGCDVTHLHPAERPVSLIFQDHNLFAHLDLAANIGLGIAPSLRLSERQKADVSKALARVGLEGQERRRPGTLSGGERQRVAFARALVRNRPILLLDEPFAALDPALRMEMADLLLQLHQETGNTILIVSHHPDEVRRIADDLVFIEGGKIKLFADLETALVQTELSSLKAFWN